MNKRGFTLVEVIVVITLLGLVITLITTSIMGASNNAKEKMLQTKIENIEKAAVLYGQNYRHKISILNTDNYSRYPLCFKNSGAKHISNCYYFLFDDKGNTDTSDDITTITVGLLANPGVDDEGNPIEPYINYDEGTNIINPVDEKMNINNCQIQIYQKYGKIYAVYNTEYNDPNASENNTKCWK